MLIYLDNCCFNRPFDDQKQDRIREETEAKLFIQKAIRSGELKLAWSYMTDLEKIVIEHWKSYSVINREENQRVIKLAEELYSLGLSSKDALHVSCGASMNCDFFITTDDEIIKKLNNFKGMIVLNPVNFIRTGKRE